MIHRKKEIMFASALLNVFQRSLQSQISGIIFVDRKKAFFFLSKHCLQYTNKQFTDNKVNQNNMIKISQTINMNLQPMQQRL